MKELKKEYTVRENHIFAESVDTDNPEKYIRDLMAELINDRSAHSLTDEQLEDLELAIFLDDELVFRMWSDGSWSQD